MILLFIYGQTLMIKNIRSKLKNILRFVQSSISQLVLYSRCKDGKLTCERVSLVKVTRLKQNINSRFEKLWLPKFSTELLTKSSIDTLRLK